MLSIGVCTTRHTPTSDRLVQEFNVCTVQCRHLIPALNAWAAWALNTTAHPIAIRFLVMDAWMTSLVNVALIRKLLGSLMCLDYFLT